MIRLTRPPLGPLLVAVLSVVCFGVAYARLWSFLLDDAFISVRYALNLVHGHGLVYNPGERVEGYTNFLWTVLLAVPVAFHFGPVPYLKVLSAVFALATAVATWRLTGSALRRSGLSRSPVLEVLPAALFLAMPAVALSAAEGLETMLFAFLLTLACAWFIEERERPLAWPRSAFAGAALGMTRPDGAVFGVLFLLVAISQRRPRSWTMRFAASFSLAFGLYFAIRAVYYGQWLPNTFYAKGGADQLLLQKGWDEAIRFAEKCGGWAWLAALPALFARRFRSTVLVLLSIVLVRVAFQLWSGGAWMGRLRFLIPILPPLLVMMALGLAAALRSERSRWLAAALTAALALTPGWLQRPDDEELAINYGNSLRHAHAALGERIAQRTEPGAVIAMDDAGLGPLLAQRTNVDMLGLNDAHIAHLPGRFAQKFDAPYVLSRNPDLIVLVASVPQPTRDQDFRFAGPAMFRETEFRTGYRFVREYRFDPTYYLLVYRRLGSDQVHPDF